MRLVGWGMAKVKVKQGKVGGLAFFLSLVFLTVLGGLNLNAVPEVVTLASPARITAVLSGALSGALLTRLLVKRRAGVFLHELKHSIVSNLAGNRARGMKVRNSRGHFEYEYTKRTEAYNAFIYLAPYYFPVLSVAAALVTLPLFWRNPLVWSSAIAAGFAGDMELAVRDIGPHQTDFQNLRGGFPLGLFYVIMMNLVLATTLISALLMGRDGLLVLGRSLWDWMVDLVAAFKMA